MRQFFWELQLKLFMCHSLDVSSSQVLGLLLFCSLFHGVLHGQYEMLIDNKEGMPYKPNLMVNLLEPDNYHLQSNKQSKKAYLFIILIEKH